MQRPEDRVGRVLRFSAWIGVTISLGVIVMLSAVVSNDTYDAYDYMAGAKAVALGHPEWHWAARPFGPAAVGAPWAALFEGPEHSAALFRVLHLQSALITALYLGAALLLFRSFRSSIAVFPLALLCLCRLVPRYGWSFLSDIPGALFVLLAFLVIQRNKNGGLGPAAIAGALFGVATNFKFYLLFMSLGGAAAWVWTKAHEPSRRWGSALVIVGTAAAAAALIHVAMTLVLLRGGPLPTGIWGEVFARLVQHSAMVGASDPEPWWEYLIMAQAMAGLLAVPLCLVGIARALRRRSEADRLCLVWLGSCLVLLLAAGHREARYLFPLLVPSAWLAVQGINAVDDWLGGTRLGRARRLPRTLLLRMTVLVAAAAPFVTECVALTDSFLRKPVQQELARRIRDTAPLPADTTLVGPFYPLVASSGSFAPQDEFYYVFHVGASLLTFWNECTPRWEIGAWTRVGLSLPIGLLPPGDAPCSIVASPYPSLVDADLLHQGWEPRPLAVLTCDSLLLQPASGQKQTYCSEDGQTTARLQSTALTVETRCSGLVDDWFAVAPDSRLHHLGSLVTGETTLHLAQGPGQIRALLRVRYVEIDRFVPGADLN